MKTYRALVAEKKGKDVVVSFQESPFSDLPEGEVTIRVAYTSFNYKDALACITDGKVALEYPLVPGIDLSGVVMECTHPRFKEGQEVLVTGYHLGMSHDGGFSEMARVPADWVVPMPPGLSLRGAMALGTAGFTAGLSVLKLEKHGLSPGRGPVMVTGATGGLGSTAVAILARRGYEVAASTGKSSEVNYLRALGARVILTRAEVSAASNKPLEHGRWAGAVDPVGGATLAYLIRTMKYGGLIASCGLTGGTDVSTTVFPFIIRGVSLLGIDSVFCPMDMRLETWKRLAEDIKDSPWLDSITQEVTLEEIPRLVNKILKGQIRGRTIVRVRP